MAIPEAVSYLVPSADGLEVLGPLYDGACFAMKCERILGATIKNKNNKNAIRGRVMEGC